MGDKIIKTPLDDVVFIKTQVKTLNFKCERCGALMTDGWTIMKKRFRFDNQKKEKQHVLCNKCFRMVADHYETLFPDFKVNEKDIQSNFNW